jgi:prevent-host-death family protein
MIREAPAMTVRQNLGDLLNEVQYRKGRIVITKGGKPVAALIDIALFERLRKLDEEFEQASGALAKAFAGVAVPEGSALVDEAVKAARRRKPARK